MPHRNKEWFLANNDPLTQDADPWLFDGRVTVTGIGESSEAAATSAASEPLPARGTSELSETTPVAPGSLLGTKEATHRQVIVGLNYEGKDANGKWWPITITGINSDGSYQAKVHDGFDAEWPIVLSKNIRSKEVAEIPIGTLCGTWLYGKKGRYTISADDDASLRFQEGNHRGALHPDRDWYTAELQEDGRTIGFIRLRSVQNGVESQFKVESEDAFGEAIIARQYKLAQIEIKRFEEQVENARLELEVIDSIANAEAGASSADINTGMGKAETESPEKGRGARKCEDTPAKEAPASHGMCEGCAVKASALNLHKRVAFATPLHSQCKTFSMQASDSESEAEEERSEDVPRESHGSPAEAPSGSGGRVATATLLAVSAPVSEQVDKFAKRTGCDANATWWLKKTEDESATKIMQRAEEPRVKRVSA